MGTRPMRSSRVRNHGSRAAARLQSYYADTAEQYDTLHGDEVEHRTALHLTAALVRRLRPSSLLDVGCGTGRALSFFREELPHLALRGADPSPELLRVASERHGIPSGWLDVTGEHLPYPDAAFDVAVAFGVLHHVAEPGVVIGEMLRVTRSGVFISDCNKYGQGSAAMARVKVAARALGVIRQLEWIRHGGRRWTTSPGDGLAYPFSVFDHLGQLRRGSATVLVLPTKGRPGMEGCALLHASHALVCALKSPLSG
jgi:ubiquinone/menaquinone biosynthesis C-methylase UbiE